MKSDLFTLEDSYAFQSYLLARALRKSFFKISRAAGYEMFPEQWFALYFIVNKDGQSQTELAAQAFEDRPSLSRTMKSMIDRGLVTRKSDLEDRRKSRYHATPKGLKVYKSLVNELIEARKSIYSGLTDKDYQAFEKTVSKLIGSL